MKAISTVGAMTACISCASAFVAPSAPRAIVRAQVPSSASPLRMTEDLDDFDDEEVAPPPPPPKREMSQSVPFLVRPKNLDGMVGDIGFDPFGLAEIFPVKFLREAEIKHGRVAMLAVVGWIVSEVVHLPGPAYMSENPVDAMAAVGPAPMLQIFLFCGFLEWNFHKVTLRNMKSVSKCVTQLRKTRSGADMCKCRLPCVNW